MTSHAQRAPPTLLFSSLASPPSAQIETRFLLRAARHFFYHSFTRQSEKSQSEIELELPIGRCDLLPRRDWLKSVTRVTPNFVSSFLALRSSLVALHHRTHPPTSRNHTKVQDVCHLRLHVPLRGRQGQDRARPQAVRTRAFSGHKPRPLSLGWRNLRVRLATGVHLSRRDRDHVGGDVSPRERVSARSWCPRVPRHPR